MINIIYVMIGIVIITIIIVSIIFVLQSIKRKKKNEIETQNMERFTGAALNNMQMYKQREEVALRIIAGSFPDYSKEKIYIDIEEITRRLLNAQNNGYISAIAFQKSAQDKILLQMRTMTKLETIIIGYEQNYASVAVIFENENKELYQLLLRLNVQNGLLYLDSYNATLWFNN